MNDFQNELQVGGLVLELQPVVGSIGEQMLYPRPAFTDCIVDRLGSSAVGDVGGRQIDHEQSTVRVDGDMAFPADDLLAGIVAARLRRSNGLRVARIVWVVTCV
jgi:hypothetical protein